MKKNPWQPLTLPKKLKVRYLVNYKTSVLLLLIKIAKRTCRALLENDASVHSFTELPISKYCLRLINKTNFKYSPFLLKGQQLY